MGLRPDRYARGSKGVTNFQCCAFIPSRVGLLLVYLHFHGAEDEPSAAKQEATQDKSVEGSSSDSTT